METRRLRLYVVAYLRGLLKPYYDHGYSSLVREELILSALSAELDAEGALRMTQLESMMAQHVQNKSQFFDNLYDKVAKYRLRLEFDTDTLVGDSEQAQIERLTNDPEINRLIAQYKEMKASGEYDRLDKEATEAVMEYENRPMQGFKPGDKLEWRMSKAEDDTADKVDG